MDALGSGLVSFVVDDGRLTDFTVTKPVFDAHRAVGVCAVITRRRELTDAQLQGMVAGGWEIASHGRTHTDETDLEEDELEEEIGGARADLEALGLSVTTHVYPYGAHDDVVERVTQRHFAAGVTASGGLNRRPLENRYSLRRSNFGAMYAHHRQNTLSYYGRLVDRAKVEGSWLIYMVHQLTEPDLPLLSDLLSYVGRASLPIVTVREGLGSLV